MFLSLILIGTVQIFYVNIQTSWSSFLIGGGTHCTYMHEVLITHTRACMTLCMLIQCHPIMNIKCYIILFNSLYDGKWYILKIHWWGFFFLHCPPFLQWAVSTWVINTFEFVAIVILESQTLVVSNFI